MDFWAKRNACDGTLRDLTLCSSKNKVHEFVFNEHVGLFERGFNAV
jgi:hypothetical protein